MAKWIVGLWKHIGTPLGALWGGLRFGPIGGVLGLAIGGHREFAVFGALMLGSAMAILCGGRLILVGILFFGAGGYIADGYEGTAIGALGFLVIGALIQVAGARSRRTVSLRRVHVTKVDPSQVAEGPPADGGPPAA